MHWKTKKKRECTDRARIYAVFMYPNLNSITLTLTFDLLTQTTSLLGYPYTKFEHFGIIWF